VEEFSVYFLKKKQQFVDVKHELFWAKKR